MSNRYMTQFRYSLENAVVDLYLRVSIGASGAPTLVSGQNKGVLSIVRNSAGNYTITLTDSYRRLLNAEQKFIVATGVPAAPSMNIVSDNVATLATPTVVIQTVTGSTPTDPANGEIMLLQLSLKNSGS